MSNDGSRKFYVDIVETRSNEVRRKIQDIESRAHAAAPNASEIRTAERELVEAAHRAADAAVRIAEVEGAP